MEACTFVIVVGMAFAGISTAIIQWWQRPPSPSEDVVIKELMKRLDDETLEYCVIRHNADRAPDSDDEDWINSIVDDVVPTILCAGMTPTIQFARPCIASVACNLGHNLGSIFCILALHLALRSVCSLYAFRCGL